MALTSGSSTFNLHRALDEQKIIIFNLSTSRVGASGCKLIGQLMMAAIIAYARYRRDPVNEETYPQHPYWLFADEAHYFLNEGEQTQELFKEARKFGLHLTLATQNTDSLSSIVREGITNNFGVFLSGRSAGATADTIAKRIGIKPGRLGTLPTGNFYLFEVPGDRRAQKPTRNVANPLVGKVYHTTREHYFKMLRAQYKAHYKPWKGHIAKTTLPPDAQPLPIHQQGFQHSPIKDIPDLLNPENNAK